MNIEKLIMEQIVNSNFKSTYSSYKVQILNYYFNIYDKNQNNLDYLKTFFEHYVHQNESLISNCSNFDIVSIVDPVLFLDLKTYLATAEYTKIKTFKDDVYHRRYGFDHISCSLFVPDLEVNYVLLSYNNEKYFIVTDQQNMNSLVLRIAREIIFRDSENKGLVMFHSGAISYNGKGAIICGNKASGKTTFTLGTVLAGSKYISNDRVLVGLDTEDNYNINYFPLSMRIGIGTINNVPTIKTNLNSFKWSRHQENIVLNNDFSSLNQYFGDSHKLEITSKELSILLNTDNIETSSLSHIIFPTINPEFKGIKIQKLSPEYAIKIIAEECMTPEDENWIEPWLYPRTASDQELSDYVTVFIRKMCNSLNLLSVEFGYDFFEVLKDMDILNELFGGEREEKTS